MSWLAWTLGLAIALCGAGPSAAVAAEEPPASKWVFEALPYVWIPGNFGTVSVKGRTAIIDTTVKDALDLATSGNAFTATGYFSLAYERWSVFVDAFGGYAEESSVQKIPTRFCTLCVAATAEVRPVIVDVGFGYRLGTWSLPGRQRPVVLGVYAGTRYMHFGAKLSGSAGPLGGFQRGGNVSDSFNWADPMIGIHWEVPVFDQLSLEMRSDIGGFGASSDLIWGILGGARYWPSWKPFGIQPWLGAGYRAVSLDRDFGAEGNITLDFRGPYAGLGLLF